MRRRGGVVRRGGAAVLGLVAALTACSRPLDVPLTPLPGADLFAVSDVDGVPVVVGIDVDEPTAVATARVLRGRGDVHASSVVGVGPDGGAVLSWSGSGATTSFVTVGAAGTDVRETGVGIDTGLAASLGDTVLALLPVLGGDGARLRRASLADGEDLGDVEVGLVPQALTGRPGAGFLVASWSGGRLALQTVGLDGTAGPVERRDLGPVDVRAVTWAQDGVVVAAAAQGPLPEPAPIALPDGGSVDVRVERVGPATAFVSVTPDAIAYDVTIDGGPGVAVRDRSTGHEVTFPSLRDESVAGLALTADGFVAVLGTTTVLVRDPGSGEVASVRLPGPSSTAWGSR
ncbi:hypothetical protein [Cellulomonas fimi]|uniref:Lipoprotein n=1 Tax=Cellulomonas fimi (strain ATCC 484 / DSM 20113 / JCM 1341 / CCUG 24087 / LMG 16345 / NBRC 15513 / NCIMB 8980 / NCTC 7547 / NRS-133) TaxID=590998 RepID=F4H4P5_CELFA|nr:hypothetical protein [Cellulomonas fimi]AEE44246.1 hypothetical protein Celf_0096 [Cellulomonas fimi ATCC 484]NNH05693.1 hypothetical protein [Cellulomonas fimi]VEH25962.1 Uncharacterised protein [Cellulomonas fimi]